MSANPVTPREQTAVKQGYLKELCPDVDVQSKAWILSYMQ